MKPLAQHMEFEEELSEKKYANLLLSAFARANEKLTHDEDFKEDMRNNLIHKKHYNFTMQLDQVKEGKIPSLLNYFGLKRPLNPEECKNLDMAALLKYENNQQSLLYKNEKALWQKEHYNYEILSASVEEKWKIYLDDVLFSKQVGVGVTGGLTIGFTLAAAVSLPLGVAIAIPSVIAGGVLGFKRANKAQRNDPEIFVSCKISKMSDSKVEAYEQSKQQEQPALPDLSDADTKVGIAIPQAQPQTVEMAPKL